MNNLHKLKQAFSEGLSISIDDVHEDLSYLEIVEWDSMSHLFLVKEIENSFDIVVGTEDILEMNSFKNIKEVLGKFQIAF
ncbi:MAG TPA: acyl carrier protein [Flavobacterium sp.]|uniref:acyl carrier protein n=1 Tax=Flavobacterium sp. TaxID=239 RepID=UPI002ED1855F